MSLSGRHCFKETNPQPSEYGLALIIDGQSEGWEMKL